MSNADVDETLVPLFFVAVVERVCRTHYWRIEHGKSPSHRKSALTNELLDGHLRGDHRIGVCPIQPGESVTRIGLLDIDDHEGLMQHTIDRDTSALLAAAHARGLSGTAVKSASGTGRHVYFFWPFGSPQSAFSVRETLTEILAACGFRPGTGGLPEGEIEVYPKQDGVPADGFGSMFVLPLLQHLPDSDWSLTRSLCEPLPETRQSMRVERTPSAASTDDLRTPEEIDEVLQWLPNAGSDSLNYDHWFRVICGIHSATGGSDHGLAIALAWSAHSPKHSKSPEFLEHNVWPYIREDRHPKVTFATVEAMAHDVGWRPGHGPRRVSAFEALEGEEGGTPQSGGEGTLHTGDTTRASAIAPLSAFTAALEAPTYVWDEILQKACLYALTARWGHGKTALAISVALHVAAGRPLAGHLTAAGRVLYLCGENPADVRLRVVAALEHFGFTTEEQALVASGVWFTERPFPVDEPRARARFLNDAVPQGPFALTVVDTGPAHSNADEENDNREMHALAMALRDFMEPLGNPATIVMMHPSKGAFKDDLQPRGGGAFSGSIDGELCCWQETDDAGGRVVEFFHRTKFRGPGFVPIFWHLERVAVGGLQTNFGNPVTTVVAVPGQPPAPKPSGKWQKLVVDAVHDLQGLDDDNTPVSTEDIIEWCLTNSDAPNGGKGGRDERPKVIRRAIEALIQRNNLTESGGMCSFFRR